MTSGKSLVCIKSVSCVHDFCGCIVDNNFGSGSCAFSNFLCNKLCRELSYTCIASANLRSFGDGECIVSAVCTKYITGTIDSCLPRIGNCIILPDCCIFCIGISEALGKSVISAEICLYIVVSAIFYIVELEATVNSLNVEVVSFLSIGSGSVILALRIKLAAQCVESLTKGNLIHEDLVCNAFFRIGNALCVIINGKLVIKCQCCLGSTVSICKYNGKNVSNLGFIEVRKNYLVEAFCTSLDFNEVGIFAPSKCVLSAATCDLS